MASKTSSNISNILESGKVSPDSRFVPPCSCEICETQFLSIKRQSKPGYGYAWQCTGAAAQRSINRQIRLMKRDRDFLRNCLHLHGDRLLQLWESGTANREAYLRASKVAIPAVSWPCVAAWFALKLNGNGDIPDVIEWRIPRKTWLAPHLSVQSLAARSSNFLSFLHNHAKYSPEQWFAHKNEQLNGGWALHAFKLHVSDTCVMIRGDKFGQVLPWYPEAVHRGDAVSFSRGVLAFEALQHELYVARAIVTQMMLSVDATLKPASRQWVTSAAQGFRIADAAPPWSSPPEIFCVKPNLPFDPNLLIQTAQARKEAKEDHLKFLQSDPEYMRDVYYEVITSWPVLAEDKSETSPYREIWFYATMIQDLHSYNRWRWIQEECEKVRRISIDEPERLSQALACLDVLLKTHREQCREELSGLFTHHSRFKDSHFKTDVLSSKWNLHYDAKLYREDRLEWCLRTMWASRIEDHQRDTPGRIDYPTISGILTDYLIDHEDDRNIIVERVADIFSSIASLDLMQRNIRLHRPITTHSEKDIERLTARSPDPDISLRYRPQEFNFLDPAFEALTISKGEVIIPHLERLRVIQKLRVTVANQESQNFDDAKRALNEYRHFFYGSQTGAAIKLGFSKAEAEIQLSTIVASYDAHEATLLGSTASCKTPEVSSSTSEPKKKRKTKRGNKKTKRGKKGKAKPRKRVHSTSKSAMDECEDSDCETESEVEQPLAQESESLDNETGSQKHQAQDTSSSIDVQESEVSASEPPSNDHMEHLDDLPEPVVELERRDKAKSRPLKASEDFPVPKVTPRYLVSRKTLDFVHDIFFANKATGSRTWREFLAAMHDIDFVITQHCGSETQFQIPAAKDETGSVGGKMTIDFHRMHWSDARLHHRELRRMGRRLESRWGWNIDFFGLRPKS